MSILILELILLLTFDSFGAEHISKEFKNFIPYKNIQTNIFKIQAYYLVMCRYFSIGFVNFMLQDKTLRDFTNLFYQIIF